jgi:hypothetical protein
LPKINRPWRTMVLKAKPGTMRTSPYPSPTRKGPSQPPAKGHLGALKPRFWGMLRPLFPSSSEPYVPQNMQDVGQLTGHISQIPIPHKSCETVEPQPTRTK